MLLLVNWPKKSRQISKYEGKPFPLDTIELIIDVKVTEKVKPVTKNVSDKKIAHIDY